MALENNFLKQLITRSKLSHQKRPFWLLLTPALRPKLGLNKVYRLYDKWLQIHQHMSLIC